MHMIKAGQPLGVENVAKIGALKKHIYGLLQLRARSSNMTTDELVNTLMSAPYDVPYEDLDLITIALNGLASDDHMRVSFRTNKQKITVEPIFRTV